MSKLYRFSRFSNDVLSEETDKYCQVLYLFSYFDIISTSIKNINTKSLGVIRTTFTHDHSKMDRRKKCTNYTISCKDNTITQSYIKFDTDCPFTTLKVITKPHSSNEYNVHYLAQLVTSY